jgi:tetratricopeptide (TPR) repeat protein
MIEPAEIPAELRAAMMENPVDPRVWFNLGAIAHNAGNDQVATDGFRRAVLIEPGFAAAQAQLMTAAARCDGPAAGLAMATRLACVVPGSAQNRALITQYLFELGRDGEVAAAGAMSLVLDPAAAGLYRLMALSASRGQEMAVAAGLLKRALALRPDWVDARVALAGAWFALRKFEAATRELDCSDAKQTGEGAMLRGRALWALDRRDEAETSFALAVGLEAANRQSIDIVRQTMDGSLFRV